MTVWARRAVVCIFYGTQLILCLLAKNYSKLWRYLVEPMLLCYSFIAIGLLTSDFLTPNLSILSKDILGISERVSGMTLLALGNSIPDITSTYQSIKKNATPLAIGELLGAIFFLVTVVIGLMPMIRPIDLFDDSSSLPVLGMEGSEIQSNKMTKLSYKRSTFMKDLLMFSFMILLSLIFLFDGRLMFWECASMTAVYSVYVIYLIRHKEVPEVSFSLPVSEGDDIERLVEANSHGLPLNNEENDSSMSRLMETLQNRKIHLRAKIRQYLRANYVGCMKLNLRDTLDLWESNELFDDKGFSKQRQPVIRRSTSQQDFRQPTPTIEVSCDNQENSHGDETTPLASADDHAGNLLKPIWHSKRRSLSADHLIYLDNRFSSSHSSVRSLPQSSNSITSISEQETNSSSDTILRGPYEDFSISLQLIEFCKDKKITMPGWEFAIMLVTTPVILILTLFIPVPRDQFRNTSGLSNVAVTQIGFCPLVMCYLITEQIRVSFAVVSIFSTVILFYANSRHLLHAISKYTSAVAFVLSLAAITYAVKFVVATLKNWVEYFDVSESILGLTVFAWGNSIGDLVSNITFTRIGVLDIALGACFGGPLLYFLFGIGIDGMLIIPRHSENLDDSLWRRYIEFQVDPVLVVTCVGLLIAFAIYIIVIPLNSWKIDKKVGSLFLTLYCIITATNILLEVK